MQVFNDTDNDGVSDEKDKCPSTPGLAKNFGCPILEDSDGDGIRDTTNTDIDNDGIFDIEDKCPREKGLSKYGGCPVPDSDGDGLNDEIDRCPFESGAIENYGCSRNISNSIDEAEIDSDKDGVPDKFDKCKTKKGSKNNNGCPESNITYGNDSMSNHIIKKNQITLPNATIAYSYFTRIKHLETKDIKILLKIQSNSIAVAEELREINRNQSINTIISTDTNTIKTLTLIGYRTANISLEYDKSDFEIKPVNTDEEQEIDSIKGNYWHWRVKAITEKPVSKILIKVRTENPKTKSVQKDSRDISIKIIIDNLSGLRKMWNWMLNNPHYTIPSIIVPVFIFFFSRRKKRKDDAKGNSQGK